MTRPTASMSKILDQYDKTSAFSHVARRRTLTTASDALTKPKLVFTSEDDDGKGGRREMEEIWFMLTARKGGRFMRKIGRSLPGVHRGDMNGS